MKNLWKNKKISIGFLILFLITLPFLLGQSGYYMSFFSLMFINVIAAMSLNLLSGYGGQISVGNAGFLSIGGYAVAILGSTLHLNFWLAFPMAGVITAFIGLLIGIPAVRLNDHFLAVATLGFGLSVPLIILNWESLTAGYSGIAVSRPSLFSDDLSFFYVIVLATSIITWLLYNIVKSRMGRAFIAIRDSEVAAQSTGINVPFYKTIMFVISAFFTGLAGALYAYWVGFVSPEDFTIVSSFLLLAMIVVGGVASIPGAIIGAVLLTIIPHFTDVLIGMTNIMIGVAVVLIILFLPKGLVSLFNLRIHVK